MARSLKYGSGENDKANSTVDELCTYPKKGRKKAKGALKRRGGEQRRYKMAEEGSRDCRVR